MVPIPSKLWPCIFYRQWRLINSSLSCSYHYSQPFAPSNTYPENRNHAFPLLAHWSQVVWIKTSVGPRLPLVACKANCLCIISQVPMTHLKETSEVRRGTCLVYHPHLSFNLPQTYENSVAQSTPWPVQVGQHESLLILNSQRTRLNHQSDLLVSFVTPQNNHYFGSF